MTRPALALAVLTLPFAGCEEALEKLGSDEDKAFAMEAVDSVEITQDEALLVAAAIDGIDLASEDTQGMATHAAAQAQTTFSPEDCVQAVAAQSTVTYTFDNCAGPGDLVELTGVVNVSFSVPASESVTVSMTSSDLGMDGVFGTVNATGTYSEGGDTPILALQTSGAATTESGDLLGRLGAYTASLDGDCVELNGEWTTSVNDTTFFATTATEYRDCVGACPEAGAVSHSELTDVADMEGTPTGEVIALTYTGNDTVAYVAFDGTPGVLALDCP